MDSQDITIVCYTGGTCGDLVTALIDSSDTKFNCALKTVVHLPERARLKKPHLFASDADKDQYINDIRKNYSSIPSHDLDYHVRRQHVFVGITVQDLDTALWAAKRFRACHRPHVWEEMQRLCGANSVENYAQVLIDFSNMLATHTDKIVKLEDIKHGTVIPILENMLSCSISKGSKNLYQNWLDLQRNQFII